MKIIILAGEWVIPPLSLWPKIMFDPNYNSNTTYTNNVIEIQHTFLSD